MPSGALGSDASRLPSSSIHMPSPNVHLDFSHDSPADGSPSLKRKRDVEAMEELLRPSIVIKPHPPNISIKPRSLQPLMILPREHLQLSFLDLSSPYGSFEFSRYFESKIKVLELESRIGSRPVVLIARLESDKTLYVLERQTDGLYSLCQFGSWVDLRELRRLATVSCTQLIEKRTNTFMNSNTSYPLTTPHLHHETKKRRLAIEAIQSLVKKPARSRSVSTTSQLIPPVRPLTPGQDNDESQPEIAQISLESLFTEKPKSQTQSQIPRAPTVGQLMTTPTAEGIFDNIRNQYLESLYHSMGSLAYFAKGPLSRARAAFHLDCDSNLDMNDLVDFLKSLVMTTTQIDKKYRETIPDLISKMKPIFQDSDVEQGNAKTKKRKTRKMKLGKNGLYPMEHEYIQKWWSARKPEFKDDEAMTTTEPPETKLQVAWLRSRETQLQMIIILEILALEPLVPSQSNQDSQLPGLPLEELPAEAPKDNSTKKRNRHNLPSLVDVHADRLCIWQSTALDGVKLPDDAQASAQLETQKSSRATSDPLKDFCVDIIVPFFSARLPEKCDSINRKLGGPVMMPPSTSKSRNPENSEPVVKSKSKSSSATKRPTSKSSKTLESVLSKETEKHRRSMSRGPSGVIALMRSASTSMLKREASEPLSISNIPKADSITSKDNTSRAPALVPIKRRLEGERAKKDALVKAELHDAISALRRPNRDVIGKAMAEADERRAITSLSQLKKSRKPTQHKPPDVVKATPIGKRFKDVLGTSASNQPSHSRITGPAEPSSTPSSSLIPSSAPRKRTHEAAFALDKFQTSPRSRTSADQVQATPARPSTLRQSALLFPEVDETDILASSPIMARKVSMASFRDSGIEMPSSPPGALAETPVKPRTAPIPLKGLVAATPIKRRILDKDVANIADTRNSTTENVKEPERRVSIFERLGWDDDFDELG
ncbi:DNA replication regulator SLD3-domain-containing protein [Daldinia decipiens]|uniref:DNA replication regulator SLD3-domain-containing protein n=1 Tax=Daldinia decipiens TaxID=326647 RepID=UPI0020C4A7CE|nr:DNA replication regulator SLD3-domain-containing protein [Daldinia decipiens]KAI1657079.1 DNA replication regulator SLD3-domain-containing protein [Daldinia decipiens]